MARRAGRVVYEQRLTELARKAPDQLEEFGRKVITQMTTEVVTSFGSGPPGRQYGNHVASSPGYPPNVDSGALRASINWRQERKFRFVMTDGVKYGAFLEFGTSKMAARPFMSPVFERYWRREIAQMARNVGLLKL